MDLETTYLLVKDVIYEGNEENLLQFSDEEENKISIYVSNIEPELQKEIKENWNLFLHDKQLVVKTNIEFPDKKPIYFYKKEIRLYKSIIFSFVTSIKDFHIIWEKGLERKDMGFIGGVGTGLPFAILKFTEKGEYVNVFYANDYEKVRFNHEFFVLFDTENVTTFRYILKKVLTENTQAIPEFIRESFSLIHTINWVKEGWFYLASIILFSCFESLLNKKMGEQIKDLMNTRDINLSKEDEHDLEDFQILRNAIAHPSEYNIKLKNNTYYIYKNAELKATFSVKRLENIRKLLTELLIREIK